MEIYWIRHTTPAIEQGVCYGQHDIALAGTFEAEIPAVLQQLPRVDQVYSSPLQRCTRLASHIAPIYTLDSRLLELNFGNWELKRWDAIPAAEIAPWYKDWVHYAPPHGESFAALAARVSAFIEALCARFTDQHIVVVAHAGVIKAAYAYCHQMELKAAFNTCAIAYGKVVHIPIPSVNL